MTVSTTSTGDMLIATLDDGKANALSLEVVWQLRDALRVATEDSRALIIVGRSGTFCAGFDLSVMRGEDRHARTELLVAGEALFCDIIAAPIPVVAACTGHALAAGALLLLSADYRIGGMEAAKIGLNEVRIGMALPPLAMALARHRLATTCLTSATLFAEVGTPERAMAMGFLDTLAESVLDAAIERTQEYAALPRDAFTTTKQRLRGPLLAEIASLRSPAK